MDTLTAGILGVVQGVTEVFPISSSAHLYLAETLLTGTLAPSQWYEVLLHGASLVAIVGYFWREIWQLLLGLGTPAGRTEAGKLLLATLLTVLGAVWADRYIYHTLTVETVGWLLLLNAMLLWGAYFLYQRRAGDRPFTWGVAVLLGIVQALAVLPGVSRSGVTLSLLLALGVEKTTALRLSFLLSIPIILGAMVYSWGDIQAMPMTGGYIGGAVLAALTCWLSLRLFMRRTLASWRVWGWWCLVLGLLILWRSNNGALAAGAERYHDVAHNVLEVVYDFR